MEKSAPSSSDLPRHGQPPPKARWRRWVRDGLIIAFAIFALHLWQSRSLLATGEMAPALPAPGLGEGRPTIVYFFAPWCGVCKISAANVATLRRWLGEERVASLAVALDYDDPAEVRAFAADYGLPEPVVLGDAELGRAYQIGAYPTYYVVDAKGRISSRSVGYSTLAGMWGRWMVAFIGF